MKKLLAAVIMVTVFMLVSACTNDSPVQPSTIPGVSFGTMIHPPLSRQNVSVEIQHRNFETYDIAVLEGQQALAFVDEFFAMPLEEIKHKDFSPTVFSDTKYIIKTCDEETLEIIDTGAFTMDDGQHYYLAKSDDIPVIPQDTVWNNYLVNSMTGQRTLRHTSTQFARSRLKEYFLTLPPEQVNLLRNDHQVITMMLTDEYWKS